MSSKSISVRKALAFQIMMMLAIALVLPLSATAQLRINQAGKQQNKPLTQAQASSNRQVADRQAAQPVKQDPKTESGSPFDAVRGKAEDLSKRDAFSKHYKNEDGSYTALIGAGPIHFEKGGQFYDISHNITANGDASYPYSNTTNLFESYFGATAHTGVKNSTPEGEITEFLNTKMYWEVNGQAVNTLASANTAVTIQADKAYYNNLYGSIAAEFAIESGRRKLNYIIPNAQALGNIPANTNYLVFTEDIKLQNNWTHTVTERGILIKDQAGNNIYLYDNPVSFDATNSLEKGQRNTIFETTLNGNVLTIKTKVKTTWLLDNARQFPIKVDPTVSVYPNNTDRWSVAVFDDGDETWTQYGCFGLYPGYWLQYHIKFNTSSIPSGSTLSSVIGYRYQTASAGTRHTSSTWNWANSADPTTTSGTTLYNSVTALQATSTATNNTNNSWKSSTFTAGGRTYVSNGINNLGYVAA
ncbi:MAG: hypothetical protein RBR78_00775, partial [Flavobacteriaceae bacterium]|nr:hypothetical protein [Flavobacteriaceae bacterium]